MAFHPQTDSQTEWMNTIMEQYLQVYINYLQDDWVDLLLLAEFATNNQASKTIGISLFFVNKGFDLQYQFNLIPTTINNVNNWSILAMSKTLTEIHSYLCVEINRASDWY
jgi:hypothetical protein